MRDNNLKFTKILPSEVIERETNETLTTRISSRLAGDLKIIMFEHCQLNKLHIVALTVSYKTYLQNAFLWRITPYVINWKIIDKNVILTILNGEIFVFPKWLPKFIFFIQHTLTVISKVNIVVKNTSRYPKVIFRGDFELSGSSAAKLLFVWKVSSVNLLL